MARLLVAGGGLGLALAICGLALGDPWVAQFFYLLAWWSYLPLLSGLLKFRTGASLLIDRPAAFARSALVSIPFWLFYEACNLRLKNWAYEDLPLPLGIRWAGYALAFATVLPAVLETAALIRSVLARPKAPEKSPAPGNGSGAAAAVAAGISCLALPFARPDLFFPLIWAPAFLVFEPFLPGDPDGESWFRRFERGDASDAISLLISGLVCGILWEALNYWAGAKWVYTVPWPQGPKLFEMPWLGYAGFPPFALGCASFGRWFDRRWGDTPRASRLVISLLAGALCVWVFRAMDDATVRSFSVLQ